MEGTGWKEPYQTRWKSEGTSRKVPVGMYRLQGTTWKVLVGWHQWESTGYRGTSRRVPVGWQRTDIVLTQTEGKGQPLAWTGQKARDRH